MCQGEAGGSGVALAVACLQREPLLLDLHDLRLKLALDRLVQCELGSHLVDARL